MSNRLALAVLSASIIMGCASASAPSRHAGETIALGNGHWWVDGAFDDGARYIRDGVFVVRPRGGPDRAVDLQGGYVFPAFAEGHHHRICEQGAADQFLNAGIVYVAIMNARVSSRVCQAQMHDAGVEVMNALAGLTEHGAHPSEIGLNFLSADQIDGDWVHYVDSVADLDRVWSRLEATHPDMVKLFLGYSEDYERLRVDPSIPSWYRGLNPALVPEIVARAHTHGLRVAAHVLSAHDFDVAVAAGVDIIAHMPGFAPGPAFTPDQLHPWLLALLDQPERYLISEASAHNAARRGIAVMTTMSGVDELPSPLPPGVDVFVEFQQRVTRANVQTLRNAGVRLLIGSDRYEFTSVDEASYLVRNHFFRPSQALRSLTRDTPRALFPGRKVGSFQAGAEASFVVLASNPLDNFESVRHPTTLYSRGVRVRP